MNPDQTLVGILLLIAYSLGLITASEYYTRKYYLVLKDKKNKGGGEND